MKHIGKQLVCLLYIFNLSVREPQDTRCDYPASQSWASFFSFFCSQVSQHRTKETFGRALIPLNKDEYPWFCHFIPCRHNLPCCDSKTFFANSNDSPFTNLLKSFQASWKCFGLPGMPMFTPVRSSISTCVRPVLFNWFEYEPLLFRSSPS